jgi:nucleotidyltransferase substrate binding protein (TIGR01987 family)
MSKFDTKFGNFEKAVQRLKEAVAELQTETASDVVRDGVIQRFEFTYELAWKSMKKYLQSIGIVDVNSPKAIIKEAFTQQIITNETTWLQMLSDRDLTSHVYKESLAVEISDRITGLYVAEFEQLISRMGN